MISLSLLNVDSFIVRQNIQRELRGVSGQTVTQGNSELDAQYFLGLSDDAVPALVDAFTNKSLPDIIHNKVGAALACKRHESGKDAQKLPWQSFHLSHWNASLAFEKINADLDGYKIIDTDWPVMVETPGGEEFSCSQYSYD